MPNKKAKQRKMDKKKRHEAIKRWKRKEKNKKKQLKKDLENILEENTEKQNSAL